VVEDPMALVTWNNHSFNSVSIGKFLSLERHSDEARWLAGFQQCFPLVPRASVLFICTGL
jgi:hypothetical protein